VLLLVVVRVVSGISEDSDVFWKNYCLEFEIMIISHELLKLVNGILSIENFQNSNCG
jgi:hypothetical protein